MALCPRADNNIINPYDEGYRAYMCDLVTELVTNYGIDGLHFDYIRYNHAANGWGETDIASLEAMGADIDHLKELIDASFYDARGRRFSRPITAATKTLSFWLSTAGIMLWTTRNC